MPVRAPTKQDKTSECKLYEMTDTIYEIVCSVVLACAVSENKIKLRLWQCLQASVAMPKALILF